jgi:outer membrane protein
MTDLRTCKRQRIATAVRFSCLAATVIIASLFLTAQQASTETLDEALASAYRYNPRIDAERARLRATDESVPQARSGYMPRIDGGANVGILDIRDRQRSEAVARGATFDPNTGRVTTSARSGDTIYPRDYSIGLQQNIFDGFRTSNSVAEAEANVRAGRETLREVERQVLLDAATAYMDVIRDKAIVRLQENNVKVLTRELTATTDRFEVGEVTRTDVSQAKARRARSVSDLDLARGNLKSARARYERVIGNPPRSLVEPRLPWNLLPKSLDEALSIGVNENPLVIQALYLEQASRHNVDVIRGELLPSVTLDASYRNGFSESSNLAESERTELTGRVNVPIYQGGEVSARVRASKHTHVSRLQEVEDARTQVREEIITAWAAFQTTQAQLVSDRTQVEANQTALTGVREEEKVGQRTLLDVLNAEQELLDAQVSLAETRRNNIVAAYALLSAIGRFSADVIGVTATVYDPEIHYMEVRRKWWGIRITHRDGRHERLDLWESHGRRHSMK